MNQKQRQEAMIARRAQWQRVVAEAEQSQFPIRHFCRERHLDENQFYHWRRVLNLEQRAEQGGAAASKARFVLVRPEAEPSAESSAAMLELILDRGWRLRIARGADEATLRSVLAALAPRP